MQHYHVRWRDTDYLPKKIQLLCTGRKTKNSWEVWSNDYLLLLQDTLPLHLKGPQLQISRQSTIGEVFIVILPHRMWKLARIKEFIRSAVVIIYSKIAKL